MEPGRSRRRAPLLVVAAGLVWMLAVAIVYFTPAARAAVDELAHSSLPSSAISLGALADDVVHLGAAAAILLAGWGLGSAAIRAARPRDAGWWGATPLEAFLTSIGLGLGVLYAVALALSALGLLRPAALAAVVVTGVVVALAQLPRRRPRRPSPPAGALQRASLVLIGAGGTFALFGALAPEVEYDALWYHLTLPERSLAAGSLVDASCQYVAAYPLLAELLFGYGLALDGAITAKLVHLGFAALTALATYAIGARVVSKRAGLVAAAILVTTPTFLWEATTAYVDVATAFFVALALLWVLRFAERPSRTAVVLAGLCLGLALATKHLAAIAALPLAAIVLLAPRGLARRERIGAAGLLAAVALLAPLPFYIRAEVLAGNPVFPSLYGVFGADPDRWSAGSDAGLEAFFDEFGYGDGPLATLGLPWTTAMHAAAFGGSIGVVYLMLAPLALRRRMPTGLLLTLLFSLGYVLLWASPVSSLQMRFVVPVLGPLAVVAAAGLERAMALAPGRAGAAAAVLVVGVLALSLPPFVRLHERQRNDETGAGYLTHVLRDVPADVVLGAEPQRAYLARRIPAYPAVSRLNELAGPQARVAVLTDPFADYYVRAEAFPDYALCLRRAGLGGGGARDHRALRREGVDYLVVEDRLADSSAIPWADAAFARRYLELAYVDGRARLYRVRARPAG